MPACIFFVLRVLLAGQASARVRGPVCQDARASGGLAGRHVPAGRNDSVRFPSILLCSVLHAGAAGECSAASGPSCFVSCTAAKPKAIDMPSFMLLHAEIYPSICPWIDRPAFPNSGLSRLMIPSVLHVTLARKLTCSRRIRHT